MMKTLAMMVGCVLWLQALPASAQQEMPKPGPEHKQLHKLVGTWDVAVSAGGMESKGVSTFKMGLGGFWLFQDFQGDFGGMKFHGRGVTGYDTIRKAYVDAWVDSMSPSLMTMYGHFSKDGKTYTAEGEGPGMDGKLAKMKTVEHFKSDDEFTMTMYIVSDGKDTEMMTLTYKRHK